MFFVYILQSSKDGRTYVGYTDNFDRRFKQHNSGRSSYTRSRAPFNLLFKEEFENSVEAKKEGIMVEEWCWKKKAKRIFSK